MDTFINSMADANYVSCSGKECASRGGAFFTSGQPAKISLSYISNNYAVCLTLGSPCSSQGGALFNLVVPTEVKSSTLTNNHTTCSTAECLSEGGAVYNMGGDADRLSFVGTTLDFNTAQCSGDHCASRGGAAFNTGPSGTAGITFFNSTVDHNQARCDPILCTAWGGGISNHNRVVVVIGTTISNNAAGGGIMQGGHAAIQNSTFSANWAYRGGGIYSIGLATIEFTTMRFNGAVEGGGLFNTSNDITVHDSIIAHSLGDNCHSLSQFFYTSGFNISSDGTCFGFTLHNTDPLLGPLADNGGPTRTHAPKVGSPALDVTACLGMVGQPIAKDQRGFARPGGLACDVGAVEGVGSRSSR
jgi:hypothetical protein